MGLLTQTDLVMQHGILASLTRKAVSLPIGSPWKGASNRPNMASAGACQYRYAPKRGLLRGPGAPSHRHLAFQVVWCTRLVFVGPGGAAGRALCSAGCGCPACAQHTPT